MENNKYKCLTKSCLISGKFLLTHIKVAHRYKIMKWRNEQLYHLRQEKILTREDQDIYFETIIKKQFNQSQPDQILFSLYYDKKFVAYGGLVHINWIDKNAEVSLVINTKLEQKNFGFFQYIYD